MVVVDIVLVVYVVPLPSDEPPDAAAYQLIVPALAVAPRPTVPEPQRDAGEVPVIDGPLFIVKVAGFDVALSFMFVNTALYL